MKIDLHIHSKNSDGNLSIEEIFKIADKSDIRTISITDHDYIGDYSYLANKYGILAITGIEFNTTYKKMHILGYGIKDIDKVKKIMNELSRHNEDICLKVIEMLRLDGFDISKNQVIEFCKENNLNYQFINKKLIVKYLIYKNYSSNVKEAYDSLIGRDAPYYYGIDKLSPKEVIELINNTGGISIWAHPELMKLNNYLVVDKLKGYGLNGIEVTKRKNEKERKYYELRALDENFITTYGSDFHSEQDEMGVLVDEEKVKTCEKLKEKGKNMRVIYVAKPKVLESINYDKYFIKNKPNIYCYHGYAKAIKALLYNCDYDIDIYGYEDLTYESGYVNEKLKVHNIDSDSLVKKLVK